MEGKVLCMKHLSGYVLFLLGKLLKAKPCEFNEAASITHLLWKENVVRVVF
jgi:hypothetical protein